MGRLSTNAERAVAHDRLAGREREAKEADLIPEAWTIGARLSSLVKRFPDRVALELGTERVTGASLILGARDLGATLDGLPDHGTEPVVAILGQSGVARIRGLVGAWLAALAVAPLDPDQPPTALGRAIADLRPRALLVDGSALATAAELRGFLPPGTTIVLHDGTSARALLGGDTDVRVVVVERRAGARWTAPDARPDAGAAHFHVDSRDGGRWVLRSHAALLADVDRHATRLGLEPGERVSHLHALSGHRGLVDLLLPWSVGGTACAPGAEAALQGARWLRTARLGVLRLTPTRLRTLAAAGALNEASLRGIRAVVLEGEGFRGEDVAPLVAAAPRAVIESVYGRTELGSALLVHSIQPGQGLAVRELSPIGLALPGVRVSVVGPQGRRVEPGETGLLVVQGPDGAPVHTGDRVRVEPGRGVCHRGRGDDLVQLGGRRVSLDRLEQVIAELAGAPAVAVAWPLAGPGSATGWVAFVETGSLDTAGVRRSARAQLPRDLLPGELLAVPGLPRLPGGSGDRVRLTRFLAARDMG